MSKAEATQAPAATPQSTYLDPEPAGKSKSGYDERSTYVLVQLTQKCYLGRKGQKIEMSRRQANGLVADDHAKIIKDVVEGEISRPDIRREIERKANSKDPAVESDTDDVEHDGEGGTEESLQDEDPIEDDGDDE